MLFIMKQLLKKLVETPGVSGNEKQIRKTIKKEIEDHVDELKTDSFGNLIAKKGKGDKKLLIDAHMDQIGLSVRRIDENGFLKVTKLGGIYPVSIINQRVNVHRSEGETITGILGTKPVHLMDKEERENGKLPKMEKMYVDIGAEDKEDAEEMGIKVGDTITYQTELEELQNNYVTGPALDNRVGCAVAIETLKKFDEDYQLVVVFAAQEEVGLKGAKTSVYGINPDAAIAIDTSQAGDIPGVEPDDTDNETQAGPTIDMVQAGGRGLITPETVKKWLIQTAEENNHEYTRTITKGGATDAAAINLIKEGIPTGSVGVPTRGLHSPVEVANIDDMKKTVNFLEDVLETFPEHF